MTTRTATFDDAPRPDAASATASRGFFGNILAAMPPLTLGTVAVMITAGAIATCAFDLYGQSLSPIAGMAKLAPIGLATGTWEKYFGVAYVPGAYLLHYFVGLIMYPAAWFFIWNPLVKGTIGRVANVPWMLSAAVFGVCLWVYALYFMAYLSLGLPFFLGWTGITWVALVGHIQFAFIVAFYERRVLGRQATERAAYATV